MSYRFAKLVLLAIVAIVVVSLSFSITRQWYGDAIRQNCQVNLGKVGRAFRLYQNDYGMLPPEATNRFLAVAIDYGVAFKSYPTYDCLSLGYGDNQLLGPKVSLDELSPQTALVWDGFEVIPKDMDSWCKEPHKPIPGFDRQRHNNPHGYKGANMLLVDGHAAFFYARTPPEKLLPFFDPAVAQHRTKITNREGEEHEARSNQ